MRIEVREIKWYSLAELKELDDHGRAFEAACQAIVQATWEDSTKESINEDMVYAFAEQIGEPDREKYGEADYPGVPGVKLEGWDLDRGQHVAMSGTLTRENAPALPWHESISEVALRSVRHGTDLWPRESDEAIDFDLAIVVQAKEALEQAVQDALNEALAAGNRAEDSSREEEYLLDLAAANEWEFTETGSWS